ncbi:heparinase II/III family protein [Echinicola jeungdonensis]|uniref:Heparinase II/III family protein n=1 Tax=Echinicola jeungdonensis TaxID=709343 RepID=A0ABV5JBD3_9BACT|nr:heparinase II/III family protein [Echinicola jeungdonensis]MDN3670473.1 heparinase II/III family protein [Echinicola jeungdonensis]
MINYLKTFVVLILITIFCLNTVWAQKREYLLHTDQNIARLKRNIEQNDEVANAWKEKLEQAEKLMERDRWSAADCQVLATVYRMTGDGRFAEAIRQTLLYYVGKETWEGRELLNRAPSWKGGLGTAHTCFFLSLGYDAAYNYLSKGDRKIIAEGMVRLGIQPQMGDWINPETNFHTFDTMGHNWWSACVYMAGYAAMAIRNEIPEAKEWVEQISATGPEWVNYSGSVLQNKIPNFDKDGGFYESINYAAFGVSQYLLFRYSIEHVMPEIPQPELSVLEKMADFFIYTTYYVKDGKPLSVNFGDSRIDKTGNACVVLLYNMGYQKERYSWYLKQSSQGADREGFQLYSPNGLMLYPELPELKNDYSPDLPLSKLYADMDWATMRNSWKKDATMLAVKSGFSWNHSHADAGSYILFHKGKNLIIDSGNSSYANPLYTQYYCQSEAHNVILFDGKGQDRKDPYFGTVNHGNLHHLIEGEDFKYLLADASGPYAHLLRRNYRNFLWIGDVILVIDDLLAHEPGNFEWLLHYNGESGRNGKDLSIKDGSAEVLVHPLFPEEFPDGGLPHDFPEQMNLEKKMGYNDHHHEKQEPYWSISHFEETSRTKFVNAILLKEDGKDIPIVERFEGKDFLGLRIIQNGKITEVYFNLLADGRLKHRNSVNDMNGWKTDAYLTALTFEEGADRSKLENIQNLFIGHGSYLRRDGQVLMHSLSKFFAGVDFGKVTSLSFDGQEGTKVFIRTPSNQIKVNQQKVDVTQDKALGGHFFKFKKNNQAE